MYDLYILPAAQKDFDRLEARAFERILEKVRALAENPRPPGSLKLTGEEGYRLRVGDHRVLYRIDDPAKTVYIYRVRHRRTVYS